MANNSIPSKPLSFAPSMSNSISNPVNDTVSKTVTIPPACKMEIPGWLPAESRPWLIEGVQQRLLVARSVVIPTDDVIPVHVVNTSTLPVTLHQGMKVATAELVDDTHINGVVETDLKYQLTTNNKENIILKVPLSGELTDTQRGKFLHFYHTMTMCWLGALKI